MTFPRILIRSGRTVVTRTFLFLCLLIFVTSKLLIVNEISSDWDMSTPRDLKLYVRPESDTVLLYPAKVARLRARQKSLFIMVVVPSAPGNFEHRNAIRLTWAKQLEEKYIGAVVFLMGLHEDASVNERVREEGAKFGDIVVQAFADSYNNLTVKSVMMLKFVLNTGVPTEYIMKADDDTFVNVKGLLKVFPNQNHTRQITGKLFENSRPIRWAWLLGSDNYKWICPTWMFKEDFYPDYVAGVGYLFPAWMATCLYQQALTTPLLYLEDVFLTGIVAQKCGYSVGNQEGFFSHRINPCTRLEQSIFVIHYVTPRKQFLLSEIFDRNLKQQCYNIYYGLD